ncbi:MAG: SRPBCC family protein [Woeseiaceae bacterium]
MTSETDQIEKKILLRAPLERVWQAISDSKQFGTWFGVEFDEPFAPGASISGRIVPTGVDAEVAKMQEPHTGMACDITVDRIEPMTLFSFRWHPYAVEPGGDYSKEPTTLVTFRLADGPDGTLLTITESGFDRIPLARRAEAFASNEQGWAIQTTLIEKYLAQAG